MRDGELTEKEREILRRLLQEKEIREYEIVLLIGEGRELPGSTYEDEIESISGTVVTATDIYGFWLDWMHDHYTLGDEKEYWFKIKMDELSDAEDITAGQRRLHYKERYIYKDKYELSQFGITHIFFPNHLHTNKFN